MKPFANNSVANPRFLARSIGGILLVLSVLLRAQETELVVRAERESALYRVGETVTFVITFAQDGNPADNATLPYQLRLDDFVPVAGGELSFRQGTATVTYTFEKPSWMLLSVTPPKGPDGKPARAVLGGAMCEPEKLRPGAPCPDDFAAFWNGKKAELDAMPYAPKLELVPERSDDRAETYAIELKNIQGSTIYGFLAKPKGEGPFPALIKVNAAGVYGLTPAFVADYARRGALAIDINPHDIPNGQPREFYEELKTGRLRGYTHMGRDSRETSYFLRMFCSCYRVAQYITSLPEWDGKHLVVTGSSQGGGQAFVTAGLCPKVTAFTANVPALCDHGGVLLKRRAGWPQWCAVTDGTPDPAQLRASQYFDAANFAPLTNAKALVSCGFIDRTCSPASVWAAFNMLPGQKKMVNMPDVGHASTKSFGERQREFIQRELGLQ